MPHLIILSVQFDAGKWDDAGLEASYGTRSRNGHCWIVYSVCTRWYRISRPRGNPLMLSMPIYSHVIGARSRCLFIMMQMLFDQLPLNIMGMCRIHKILMDSVDPELCLPVFGMIILVVCGLNEMTRWNILLFVPLVLIKTASELEHVCVRRQWINYRVLEKCSCLITFKLSS